MDLAPAPRPLGPNKWSVLTLMRSSDAKKSGSLALLSPGAGGRRYRVDRRRRRVLVTRSRCNKAPRPGGERSSTGLEAASPGCRCSRAEPSRILREDSVLDFLADP